jgi:hypothetical protein
MEHSVQTHGATSPDSEQGQVNLKKLFLLCVLLVFVTPDFGQSEKSVQKNISTIQFIQSLEIDEPINLLEARGGYHYYLGLTCHSVNQKEKNARFDQFRADRNINMIVVSDDLGNDTRFKLTLNGKTSWKSIVNLDIYK